MSTIRSGHYNIFFRSRKKILIRLEGKLRALWEADFDLTLVCRNQTEEMCWFWPNLVFDQSVQPPRSSMSCANSNGDEEVKALIQSPVLGQEKDFVEDDHGRKMSIGYSALVFITTMQVHELWYRIETYRLLKDCLTLTKRCTVTSKNNRVIWFTVSF